MGYGVNGILMASRWKAGLATDMEWGRYESVSGTIGNYDYFNGHIFHFGGYNPLTIFFINCLCGALSVILVYAITKRLFGRKAALLSGWFVALCPSLILWSSQNLKEPAVILSNLVIIWSLISIWNNFRFRYLFMMIIPVAILASIRSFLIPIFLFSFSLAILLGVGKGNGKCQLLFRVAVFAFLIYFSGDFFRSIFKTVTSVNIDGLSIERICRLLSDYRGYRAEDSLAFFSGVDLGTPQKMLSFAPIGFIYALLAPFPWQVGSISQIMAVPEMIAWYILIPMFIRGVRIVAKREERFTSIFLCTFCITYLSLLALIDGNIGTMFRHRAIAWILFFVFIGGGIALGREEKDISHLSAQKAD